MKPPPKPFKCTFDGCNKTFIDELYFKKHSKTGHLKPIDRTIITCPTCLKDYVGKTAYQIHSKYSHRTGPPKYVCTFEGCGKGFHQRSSLKKHSEIHIPGRK